MRCTIWGVVEDGQLVDGGAKANVRRGYVMGGERERERGEVGIPGWRACRLADKLAGELAGWLGYLLLLGWVWAGLDWAGLVGWGLDYLVC